MAKIIVSQWTSGWNSPLLPGRIFPSREALIATAKKEKKKKEFNDYEHPVSHCMEKNKNKDNPGAYCASIEDKIQGDTHWRGKDKKASTTKVAEDGWPTHLHKGRFTEYCKRNGFDGPSAECAAHAQKSDDSSVRGMASFYTNTVKP